MQIDEYQKLARNTSKWKDKPDQFKENVKNAVFDILELGEATNILKKWLYHDHNLDYYKLIDELGDMLWGFAELCSALGISMDNIAQKNIEKLRHRYGDKFTSEKSINRQSELPQKFRDAIEKMTADKVYCGMCTIDPFQHVHAHKTLDHHTSGGEIGNGPY